MIFGYSVTCCIVGLVALLLLPALAKNTYISENALIPGTLGVSSLIFDVIVLCIIVLLLTVRIKIFIYHTNQMK